VEWYNLFILGALLRDRAKVFCRYRFLNKGGWILVAILILGNIAQYVNYWTFTRTPIELQSRTLPYTHSPADYYIRPDRIKWAAHIEDIVSKGEKVILIYNFLPLSENTTDPLGLLERLYLRLGHSDFSNSVIVFGSIKERYARVPIRNISEIPAVLDQLAAHREEAEIVVLKYNEDKEEWRKESERIFSAVSRFFNLRSCQSFDERWTCYKPMS